MDDSGEEREVLCGDGAANVLIAGREKVGRSGAGLARTEPQVRFGVTLEGFRRDH